jgi:hypothetical protein
MSPKTDSAYFAESRPIVNECSKYFFAHDKLGALRRVIKLMLIASSGKRIVKIRNADGRRESYTRGESSFGTSSRAGHKFDAYSGLDR